MGTPALISIDDNLATPDDEDYGYIVEFNMDYHEHLHAHCDYPFPTETMTYMNQYSLTINIIW